jgi:predicted dehydrogenase
MSKTQKSRRSFLKKSAVAGVAVCLNTVPHFARGESPNDKLNLGYIAVNGRANGNMAGLKNENVAALCDVRSDFLAEKAVKFPKAKTYADWRKMLDQKDLDAVVICAPDHHHAVAGINAMKRGLHVYCEKPLAHSVHEAQEMQRVYSENRVATQMGTQIHATENYRRVVELIQSGAIGSVREAHVWCSRPGFTPDKAGRPAGTDPVPANLNWDLWLGAAPERPYNNFYTSGDCRIWEQYWDFGNGCIGDMGSHLIDLPYWALKLKRPISVEAEGSELRAETYPEWLKVHWEHPAGGGRPAVDLYWYDGIQRPKSPEGHDLTKWGIGVMFVGDKGTLLADYGKKILLPEADYKDYVPVEPWIAPSKGHHAEWVHACKTGAPTLCNFEYSGRLIENNLLGTVAFRAGEKIAWDGDKFTTGNPKADSLLKREYRKGWSLG